MSEEVGNWCDDCGEHLLNDKDLCDECQQKRIEELLK